ncbi:MAG: 1-deoxy-D-xylulose-5-phosphate reductoisomerase [Bacteroidales bacterium]|nr:1-deoxy-D-xylulose-5-phosphate reductoisomerase [Bacteroidales bacterium]
MSISNTNDNETPRKRIAIIGSTGSIGVQALNVIRRHPDQYAVEVLTANSNADLLIEQAIEFQPNTVVIVDKNKYLQVQQALEEHDIKVFAGEQSLTDVMEMGSIDTVLTAVVGFAGLKPTLRAIEYGKTIALANKETMVVAGEIVTRMAVQKNVPILPVDSEHSAIFQSLVGEWHNPIEKILLTASGGPFFGKDRKFLETVTVADALHHPNWSMGKKITIDSATLMNKGLEIIEAKWLFDVAPEQIEVVVHPQSVVHSLVQFRDGSIKAQLGLPNMELPIQYALSFPKRDADDTRRLSFADYPTLTFSKPDPDTFTCLALAYQAIQKGGNMPCVMNAANEIAVSAFLQNKISFLDIADTIAAAMAKSTFVARPSLDDLLQTDNETRISTQKLIENK